MLSRPGALPDFNFFYGRFKFFYSKVGRDVGIGVGCSRKRGDFTRRPACEVSVCIWEASVIQKLRCNSICRYRTSIVRRASACQLIYGLPRLATWMCEVHRLHNLRPPGPACVRTSSSLWSSEVAVESMSSLVVARWCSRRRWLQLSSHPGKKCLLKPRGMLFFVAHTGMLQYDVYVASASSACGFGTPGVHLSVSAVNNSQLAFRKFHLLTGLQAIGWTRDGTLMIDGRWCDRGESINDTSFWLLVAATAHGECQVRVGVCVPSCREEARGLLWVIQ